MHVFDLDRALERVAPGKLAESWDNVGLLVGDPAAALSRVLVCVDLTDAVLDEAQALGCQAVVAYHPPLFQAKKRFRAGDLAFEAARLGIALLSPHTAFDVAEGGTNDVLADLVGLETRGPLSLRGEEGGGIGRVGTCPETTAGLLLAKVKHGLDLSRILVAGPFAEERPVARVAICAGAGGSLVGDALSARADVYVVGELGHHDALRAGRGGMVVFATLHSNSERVAIPVLASRIQSELPGVSVHTSRACADPFSIR